VRLASQTFVLISNFALKRYLSANDKFASWMEPQTWVAFAKGSMPLDVASVPS
jgi:hypothetical protein